MGEDRAEPTSDIPRQFALRWKIMVGVGAILVGLGILIDWPPPIDANLPETSSFLVLVGALVGGAGLLAGLPSE